MSGPDNKTKEITALYEISKLLGSSLNLKANIRGVMAALSEYLDMRRGAVALRSGNEVSIIAAFGMTNEEIKRGKYRLGEGVIGQVAKHGAPIVIPNIGDEPLFLNRTRSREMLKKESIAFLCVPIKFKNEILGALSVDRLFVKGVSFEEDLRLLKIIASLLAQSIRLYEEVEKEKAAFEAEREDLQNRLKGRYSVENIIGQSDLMQDVFEAIHRVAPSRANVLLLGESGTGKELAAKAIHYMSPRSKKPFMKFNCAAIPEGLLESELFGHEKGAFTGAMVMRKGRFESADGGSFFLDEIGDLPLSLQPKILRVLQEREFERVGGDRTISVDIRLIAATSRNLDELVASGKFREDLYYRLNVVPIIMPRLADRKIDIPILAEHFIRIFNKENNKTVALAPEVLDLMLNYDWPGNVRELENTMERLVVMSKGPVATVTELPVAMRHLASGNRGVMQTNDALPVAIEEIEKNRIMGALKDAGWVQAKAARALGLTCRQIGYKIGKYNISRQRGEQQ
jgi:Nif-specific regulatory protein